MELFVEHLTVIDASFLDAARGLVGESWIVDLALEGELDEQGMVMDFGPMKKKLKAAIDASADHTLIVPKRAAALSVLQGGEQVTLRFEDQSGQVMIHESPAQALCWVDAEAVTIESLRQHVLGILQRAVPGNVKQIHLTLRHEDIPGPYYHYSHGLKHHDGYCQRIAHGHRSKFELWLDGIRDEALMQRWAARWQDIYLGTREDLVATVSEQGRDYYQFAYQARQGRFALRIAADRCEIMETDSTVEHIAQFIATSARAQSGAGTARARAYEGVHKGAVATA